MMPVNLQIKKLGYYPSFFICRKSGLKTPSAAAMRGAGTAGMRRTPSAASAARTAVGMDTGSCGVFSYKNIASLRQMK